MNDAPEVLAEVFRRHEHLTPDPDAVLAEIRAAAPRAARRRAATLTATAAAVVAVLVAAPVAVTAALNRLPAKQHAASASSLSYADATLIPGWLPGGWVPAGDPLFRMGQDRRSSQWFGPQHQFKGDGDDPPSYDSAAEVEFALAPTEVDGYRLPAEPRRPLPAGDAVNIKGHRAVFRWEVRPPSVEAPKPIGIARITWQLGPELWACLRYEAEVGPGESGHKYREALIRMARNATLAPNGMDVTPWGTRAPVRLTYLPPAVRQNGRILGAGGIGFPPDPWHANLRLTLDAAKPAPWEFPESVTPLVEFRKVEVRNLLAVEVHASNRWGWATTREKVDINGRTAYWAKNHTGLVLSAGADGRPAVAIFAGLPKEELIKVARGLRLVEQPNNYANWTKNPVS